MLSGKWGSYFFYDNVYLLVMQFFWPECGLFGDCGMQVWTQRKAQVFVLGEDD